MLPCANVEDPELRPELPRVQRPGPCTPSRVPRPTTSYGEPRQRVRQVFGYPSATWSSPGRGEVGKGQNDQREGARLPRGVHRGFARQHGHRGSPAPSPDTAPLVPGGFARTSRPPGPWRAARRPPAPTGGAAASPVPGREPGRERPPPRPRAASRPPARCRPASPRPPACSRAWAGCAGDGRLRRRARGGSRPRTE